MKLWPFAVLGGVAVVALVATARKSPPAPGPFDDLPPPPTPDRDGPRGERQRADAPISRRDVVRGEIVMTQNAIDAEQARDAGATQVLTPWWIYSKGTRDDANNGIDELDAGHRSHLHVTAPEVLA